MKLEGFVGPAYQLDSVNVDAQRCVNLYLESIESGRGKEGQQAYLRATPGLEELLEIGNGPIRCVHVDSIGRVFVVSGNQIFSVSRAEDWRYRFDATSPAAQTLPNSDVNFSTDTFTKTAHGFFTGLKVRASSSGTLPGPLATATDYFVIRVDANNFRLATQYSNAIAGTAINLNVSNPGNHTFTPQSYEPVLSVHHDDIDFVNGAFLAPDHGYPNGLEVKFKATGNYPQEIAPSTSYYVTNATEDSFQLAASFASALSGTQISLSNPPDAFYSKLMGSEGEYGGNPVILAASLGIVKSASMSLGGDGTDSSTIFVDGANNYLLKDESGSQTLGVLGSIEVAQATIDTTTDIIIQSTQGIDVLVSSGSFQATARTDGYYTSSGDLLVNFYMETDSLGASVYIVDVFRWSSSGQPSLSTAELVLYLNSGNKSGKSIYTNDFSKYPAPFPGYTRTPLSVGHFTFSGGDASSVFTELSSFPISDFTKQSLVGEGYGSVPTATQIVWSDGYFIVNQFGTNKFFVSDLQGFNINALSFASSEGSPDILLALAVVNRTLYALNEKTTEVYANTGNADFPFERVSGGFLEVGLAAEYSLAKAGGSLCFLGRSEDGEGVVIALSGTSYRRISTHAIEQAIRGYADPASAVGYSYQSGGHIFYVLNFAEATWVYDFATGLWHERAFTNDGELERHRAQIHAYDVKRRIHLVSDYETNQLYELKEGHFSDAGSAITRLRSTPHLSSGGNRLRYNKLTLDMETGIGLDGGVQGSSPTVMLDWSDDGGHTWSSEAFALADAGSGQIGDYKKRVIWRRLGSSRDRVFRIKITDPVKVALINADIDIEARSS